MLICKPILRYFLLITVLFTMINVGQPIQTSEAAQVSSPAEISASAWEDILRQVREDAASSTAVNVLQTTAVKKLTAGDGVGGDSYGVSVAVSGDTAVIGAHHATVGTNTNQGAAYVYQRNAGAAEQWGLVKKLTAFDGATNDYFGVSVAISGDTIVVGAMGVDYDTRTNQGAAYIYRRNANGADQWGLMKKIVAGDGTTYDYFGSAVSVSDWALVVGADSADISGRVDQGAAYIFLRNQGGMDFWGQWKKLTASDGAASDYFGGSVALRNDTLVVGAWGAAIGSDLGQGAAYIYERNNSGIDLWGQVKKIYAEDGLANDHFGYSAAINAQADTIVIGANTANLGGVTRGAAYVFARNQDGGDVWGQVQKLTAFDGAANDLFGKSVSINQNRILVGASGDDSNRGAVYRFECNQGGLNQWGLVEKITAWDGASNDNLGLSVSLNEQADIAILGAPGDDSWRGASYLFSWQGVNWLEQRKLITDEYGNYFGISSDLSGDTLVVGAYLADISGQYNAGAAYVFRRNQGGSDNWGLVKKLHASDYGMDDYFGRSVAISGDTLVVGAYGADINGEIQAVDCGAAYVFSRNWGGPDNWGEVKQMFCKAEYDHFGFSVSISGDIIVVGAVDTDVGGQANTGAAYVYYRNRGGMDQWGLVKTLTADDYASEARFGYSLDLFVDTLVVGADRADINGQSDAGAVYVFSHNWGGEDNWGQVKKLYEGDYADFFGFSVAIDGNTLIIGAPGVNTGGWFHAGAAYIHIRNLGGSENWGQLKKLIANDAAEEDLFGSSVAISGDILLVGAHGADSPQKEHAGAAYVFSRNWGGMDAWGIVRKVTSSENIASNFVGYSVAIDGSTAVVTAAGSEKAYIFYETSQIQFLPLLMH